MKNFYENNKVKKVKAWGVEQAIPGNINHSFIYFATEEARDNYYNNHDYIDKLPPQLVDADMVWEDEEAYLKWWWEVRF